MTTTEFAATRKLFAEYVNYKKPMSFDEWMNTSDDLKAAVLFVQFYGQITLAWYKNNASYVSDTDAVETVIQYLSKNVEIIKNNPKRFEKSYIFTVCANCLKCLVRAGSLKSRNDNECNISEVPGFDDEHDIFDTMIGSSIDESYDVDANRQAFWDLIESKGRETIVVVAELLGDKMDWTTYKHDAPDMIKKFKKWESNRISDSKRMEIIEDLKDDLMALLEPEQVAMYA